MILFFDTSEFNSLHLALVNAKTGSVTERRIAVHRNESDKTLGLLKKFLVPGTGPVNRLAKGSAKSSAKDAAAELAKEKISGHGIKKIFVVSGPGSFTGIRTGAAIALALSFAWDVPLFALAKKQVPKKLSELAKIKAKKVSTTFNANYGAEPNITKAKIKKLRT